MRSDMMALRMVWRIAALVMRLLGNPRRSWNIGLEGQGQTAQIVVGVFGEVRLPARRTPDLEALARPDDQRLDRETVATVAPALAVVATTAAAAMGAVQP